MGKRARVFEIVSREKHPTTNEWLLTEDKIKDGLNHRSIKKWAYICHDKDVYSEKDERDEGVRAGDVKPRHWHVVLNCGSNVIDVDIIAKWFGVASNFVRIPKGRGAFLDCVQYLTHEREEQQAIGKCLYQDNEVTSNFDFRTELDERESNRLLYGTDLSEKDQMRYDVLYHGKTLRQCMEENKILYLNDLEKLKKLRLEYINSMKPPRTRINYYLSGQGGEGKGLMSRGIARTMYPNITNDEDIFFEVGAKGAPFEGYDGQPVIIWNDRRAIDLLQELNGRGNVFNVFDTHPTRQKQNIKYGSISLCNEVNIVNSVQPWSEFLNGLSGEYTTKNNELMKAEDKTQSYRRFPMIIPVRAEDYDILINKGFLGEGDYLEYYENKHIVANMRKIRELCYDKENVARIIESKALAPVKKVCDLIFNNKESIMTEEELLAMFKDVGQQKGPNVDIDKKEYKEQSLFDDKEEFKLTPDAEIGDKD